MGRWVNGKWVSDLGSPADQSQGDGRRETMSGSSSSDLSQFQMPDLSSIMGDIFNGNKSNKSDNGYRTISSGETYGFRYLSNLYGG